MWLCACCIGLAVLAVHAAAKKFKVVVVVEKPNEKGKWHETFKVSFSLAVSLNTCRLSCTHLIYRGGVKFSMSLLAAGLASMWRAQSHRSCYADQQGVVFR